MTEWTKLGLLIRPDGRGWMRSHAANPFVLPLSDTRFRVYFSARDERQRSHTGWAEIDTSTRIPAVVAVSRSPVLAPGPLGYFDDHGVYACSIVPQEGAHHLYYVGWNPGKHDPMFYASIGLAVSRDGGLSFEKTSRAPILSRTDDDPWMVSACCVLYDAGRFRMWYISGIGWEEWPDGRLTSRYHVKYAESDDGVSWRRDGRVAFALDGNETNIARPCVMLDRGKYRAWFPVEAGEGYRISYAESDDGVVWTRCAETAPVAPSGSGWDADAVTYPWVFRTAGRLLMLYNGSAFGRDGIGVAEAPL